MIYISLGFNCNIGLALRKCKLNKETNIIDWAVSHPKDILYILENNITELFNDDPIFLTFCKKPHKYSISNEKTKIIYDKNTNLIFPHDYDKSNNSFVLAKQKYNRRLIRLNNILNDNNNKILFIFAGKCNKEHYINNSHSILFNEKTQSKEYYIYLKKLKNFIKNKYPNLNFHILAFNLFNQYTDFEEDLFSHKYFGECEKVSIMENKTASFLNDIKNNNIENTFNNLKKFICIN